MSEPTEVDIMQVASDWFGEQGFDVRHEVVVDARPWGGGLWRPDGIAVRGDEIHVLEAKRRWMNGLRDQTGRWLGRCHAVWGVVADLNVDEQIEAESLGVGIVRVLGGDSAIPMCRPRTMARARVAEIARALTALPSPIKGGSPGGVAMGIHQQMWDGVRLALRDAEHPLTINELYHAMPRAHRKRWATVKEFRKELMRETRRGEVLGVERHETARLTFELTDDMREVLG